MMESKRDKRREVEFRYSGKEAVVADELTAFSIYE